MYDEIGETSLGISALQEHKVFGQGPNGVDEVNDQVLCFLQLGFPLTDEDQSVRIM